MALVNIPRWKNDPNYRYKMPRLTSRIEGRGNGIRTNILNMGEIARSLRRPPMYPTKFFGCELGTLAKFDEAEEKALVNGNHSISTLEGILDKFIEMYVLCMSCNLPEVDMKVKRDNIIGKCNACGATSVLDGTHKVATYVIRNPPMAQGSTMKSNSAKEKQKVDDEQSKGDKKKKKKKRKDEDDDGANENDRKNDGKSTCNKKTDVVGVNSALTYDSIELWDVIARLRELSEKIEDITPQQFFNELRLLQVAQDFSPKCRIYVVYAVIFTTATSPDILEKHVDYLRASIDSSTPARVLIEALEVYLYSKCPDALNQYPYFLHKLYDMEVLEDKQILKYYSNSKNSEIFQKCEELVQPFLEWLREDEGSDCSNADVDVDENSTLTPGAKQITKDLPAENIKTLEVELKGLSIGDDHTENHEVDIDSI